MSFLAIAPEALRGLCVSDKTYHAKNMLVGLRTDMNFNVLKKKMFKNEDLYIYTHVGVH